MSCPFCPASCPIEYIFNLGTTLGTPNWWSSGGHTPIKNTKFEVYFGASYLINKIIMYEADIQVCIIQYYGEAIRFFHPEFHITSEKIAKQIDNLRWWLGLRDFTSMHNIHIIK